MSRVIVPAYGIGTKQGAIAPELEFTNDLAPDLEFLLLKEREDALVVEHHILVTPNTGSSHVSETFRYDLERFDEVVRYLVDHRDDHFDRFRASEFATPLSIEISGLTTVHLRSRVSEVQLYSRMLVVYGDHHASLPSGQHKVHKDYRVYGWEDKHSRLAIRDLLRGTSL